MIPETEPVCTCGRCLGRRYRCLWCRRDVPWCFGAADDMPEVCDDCWVVAHTSDEDDEPISSQERGL